MNKTIFTIITALVGIFSMANAQTYDGYVGINTHTPAATLDVVGAPTNTAKFDGIIAPRLTGDQMAAKTYTAAQTGALAYATAAATTPSGQVVNVTGAGYYWFDGTVWVKVATGTGGAYVEPWYDVATNTGATANTQDIYQMGKVGVGTTTPRSVLHVVAQKAEVDAGQHGISVQTASDDINSAPILFYKSRGTYLAPTPILANDRIMNLSARGYDGSTFKVGATMGILASENWSLGANGTMQSFTVTKNGTTGAFEAMHIADTGNVGIGNFFPPLNSPTNNLHVKSTADPLRLEGLQTGAATDQVLTVDATGVVKQQTAASVAAATEPWYNVATSAGATANTQNIYQMGNIGINNNSPIKALDVIGTGRFVDSNPNIIIKDSDSPMTNVAYTGSIDFRDSANNYAGYMGFGSAGNNTLGLINKTTMGDLTLGTNDAYRLYITVGGNVGINTTAPTNLLHVKATTDPLRLEGLQAGATTDQILTVDATGVVKKQAATEPWYDVATNAGATANTQNIYQMGNVGVGTNSIDARLHVYTNGFSGTVVPYRSNIKSEVRTTSSNGYYLFNAVGGSSLTLGSVVGLNVDLTSSAAINDYGVYINGEDKNYFSNKIGINTTAPTNLLHIKATTDPLRLEGLQTGAATDQILTVDATGVVKQQAASSITAVTLHPITTPVSGTDYTNTTGKTMNLVIEVNVPTPQVSTAILAADSINQDIVVGAIAWQFYVLKAIVPAGSTYRLTLTGGSTVSNANAYY